ncbi:hypothetical protein N7486_002100 [Penicillium sp. IBT 16267x]|nr:hypothetical protein N7486_002100 [Penicillium sp. IBT 16267x]
MSTPAVKLNEPELASICRSVLLGLKYIHEHLNISHGKIDSSTVLLCPDGAVKLVGP